MKNRLLITGCISLKLTLSHSFTRFQRARGRGRARGRICSVARQKNKICLIALAKPSVAL